MLQDAVDTLYLYAKNMKIKAGEYIGLDVENNMVFALESYCYKFIRIRDEDSPVIRSVFNENLIFNVEMLKEYDDVMREHWYINGIGLCGNPKDSIAYFDGYNRKLVMFNKWGEFISKLSPHVLLFTDITYNEKFREILATKSAEGSKPFIIDNSHVIYLFSGVLPLLKSDTVSLGTCDMSDGITYIAQFVITKKNFVVNCCMMCLKI